MHIGNNIFIRDMDGQRFGIQLPADKSLHEQALQIHTPPEDETDEFAALTDHVDCEHYINVIDHLDCFINNSPYADQIWFFTDCQSSAVGIHYKHKNHICEWFTRVSLYATIEETTEWAQTAIDEINKTLSEAIV